ncbi:MAG: lytic murein transglycosylase B, partial [Betaproteobacteria bacterium]|nr:lytic murein transglycosylase B [Betaproteobacteria bacterium]
GDIADELYLLVDLENRYDTEYRIGGQNFYTLTRYNKSFKYAAAVFDLSVALRARV